MKRLASLFLIFSLLTSLWMVSASPSVAAVGAPLFDEDNVVLSFGAISDIHILGDVEQAATKKYEIALQVLKKHAGGQLDAITIAGDISNSVYDSTIGEAFKTITDAQMGEGADVFFVTGNHDAQNEQWDALHQVYADLSKYTAKDLPSSRHDRGNRHMVIGGYHYIGVNMMDYWNAAEAMFADEDLAWLDRELAAARADAPGQPIFVYTHAPVYGTTYGSDLYTGTYWGSKKIDAHLAAYPEVVVFSGHLHFPIHDGRTIYQKDYTALNCGSVQYMSVENGLLQSGNQTTVAQSNTVSNGLLVQVDKQDNLKITRLDFANDAVIGEPLYVVKGDLTKYNPDYIANAAPQFGEHAGVSAVMEGESLQVTFDAATDNDLVHHYTMDIKSLPSGTVKQVEMFSEFYLYPQVEQMPLAYVMNVPYTLPNKDTAFEITLYAVDSYSRHSVPVTYTYNPKDAAPVIGGVENGGTYYTTQKVTVTDDNLSAVLVNGRVVDGEVLLAGNVDATYTVMAVDKGGNRTAAVVTMKPVTELAADLQGVTVDNVTFAESLRIDRVLSRISTLSKGEHLSNGDKQALAALESEIVKLTARLGASSAALDTDAIGAVRDITAADATAEDRTNLETAYADYQAALTIYSGNYTEDTKEAILDEMARIAEALKALGVTPPAVTLPTEGETSATRPSEAAPAEESTPDTRSSTASWRWIGGIAIGAVVLIGGGIGLFLLLRKKRIS